MLVTVASFVTKILDKITKITYNKYLVSLVDSVSKRTLTIAR